MTRSWTTSLATGLLSLLLATPAYAQYDEDKEGDDDDDTSAEPKPADPKPAEPGDGDVTPKVQPPPKTPKATGDTNTESEDEGDEDDDDPYAYADQVADEAEQDRKLLAERVRELEKRLNVVERDQSLDRVRWSGNYRTIVSSFFYTGPSPDGARNPDGSPLIVDKRNEEQWLHRLRLDFHAQPIDSVRVTGRLTMFKRFGTNTTTFFPQDSLETRIPRDNGLRLERAWVDWFITDWLAVSAGRISYTDGPPSELKNNREAPDATWGQQMVDGEYDSVDVTLTLGDSFLVRGFYASWAFPLEEDLFSSFLPLRTETENLRIFGGNADFSYTDSGDLLVQVGAYGVPHFRSFTVPIPSPNPPPNPGNAPAPLNGGLVFPSVKPDTLGSYWNVSMLALWKDIGESGLDLFGSFAIGVLNPNDRAIEYPLGPNGESVPVLGLASADVDGDTPYFFFTGARYEMPFGEDIAPKLGFEFNHASRYWISFAQPTSNLTNKLANRGNAYEAYIIQPLNAFLYTRLSYQFIDTNYSGGFFGGLDPRAGGTSPEVDQKLHAISLILDAGF